MAEYDGLLGTPDTQTPSPSAQERHPHSAPVIPDSIGDPHTTAPTYTEHHKPKHSLRSPRYSLRTRHPRPRSGIQCERLRMPLASDTRILTSAEQPKARNGWILNQVEDGDLKATSSPTPIGDPHTTAYEPNPNPLQEQTPKYAD